MELGLQMQLPLLLEMFSQMANPDYEALLRAAAAEDNPVLKQELLDQAFVFEEILEEEEIVLFDYVEEEYVENNPGIVGNSYSSYVGVYINQNGEATGDIP